MTEDTIVTTEKARKVLEKDTQERLAKCKNEMDKVLQKYACTIEVAITLTGNGNVIPNIQLVPQNK